MDDQSVLDVPCSLPRSAFLCPTLETFFELFLPYFFAAFRCFSVSLLREIDVLRYIRLSL